MSREISELEPNTRSKCRALLAAAERVGIILLVTQTQRSYAEQDALYAQGRTAPGPEVTKARGGQSWHNFRRAFDVAIVRFAGDKTPKDYYDGPWDQVGELGEGVGLEWGGRWKKPNKPDRPHFQNRGGMTLVQARRLSPKGG